MSRRGQIAHRVDDLASRHSGREFAEAIRLYSQSLEPNEQDELKQVLLVRAGDVDQAIMERVDARGWFRRQWDRAGSPRTLRRDR